MVPFFAPILCMFMQHGWRPRRCGRFLSFFRIMIVTIYGLFWLSSRIYRVGILMYGKKPNLPEIMKWIKYA